jgi:hypothetical protein
MTFLSEMDEATGLLDEAKVLDKGRDLRRTYTTSVHGNRVAENQPHAL